MFMLYKLIISDLRNWNTKARYLVINEVTRQCYVTACDRQLHKVCS